MLSLALGYFILHLNILFRVDGRVKSLGVVVAVNGLLYRSSFSGLGLLLRAVRIAKAIVIIDVFIVYVIAVRTGSRHFWIHRGLTGDRLLLLLVFGNAL